MPQIFYSWGALKKASWRHKQVLELDPLSVPANRLLGQLFYHARQYDRATEQLRKTLELDPNDTLAYVDLGLAYLQKSMYKEGIAEFEKALVISPGYASGAIAARTRLCVAGQKSRSPEGARSIECALEAEVCRPRYVASIYAVLGEKDKAFEWLEKSYEDRSITGFGSIKVDPAYDPLRSDPRFSDLLRRMNLQP